MHPWMKAMPAGADNAPVSMRLVNDGSGAELLVRAATSRGESAGLMSKPGTTVEQMEVGAGGELALRPGGSHVMIFGLDDSLKNGDKIPLTLNFIGAGPIDVEVVVEDGPSHE